MSDSSSPEQDTCSAPSPSPSHHSSAASQGSKGSRHGPRSRNGCWTCRTKKVKCDEVRPKCQRCIRLKLLCDYAPRARQNRTKSLKGGSERTALVKLARDRPWAPNLPIHLSELASSASSLDLTSADHEAIRYFRTTFAKVHHSKNPDYSLYAIIFNIAEREPMVMRVILALGGQELEFRKRRSDQQLVGRQSVPPLHHYSAALRMLARAVGSPAGDDGRQVDLDTILAALYLMVWYEQKYGDVSCSGLANHLAGAAKIVSHRCKSKSFEHALHEPTSQSRKYALLRTVEDPEAASNVLSLFSARMLVHLGKYDASAATFGHGGQLLRTLDESFHSTDPYLPFLDGPDTLHRYSYSLYRVLWAENYPQEEMLDDLENRSIFALVAVVIQLRFKVAELDHVEAEAAPGLLAELVQLIRITNVRFGEILGVAGDLSAKTDNSHRLVANMREIVPQYYAVPIALARTAKRRGLSYDVPVESYIDNMMTLHMQAFKFQGDEALLRGPWSLYVAALDTSKASHREWITARFHGMSAYGNNYLRAYRFLVRAQAAREACGGGNNGPFTDGEIARAMLSETGEAEMFVF